MTHFNQTRKRRSLETEVYYKSFAAPFSECFNQTLLDIWNRSPCTKPGGGRKLWFVLLFAELFDDPEHSARSRDYQLQQQEHRSTSSSDEKAHQQYRRAKVYTGRCLCRRLYFCGIDYRIQGHPDTSSYISDI